MNTPKDRLIKAFEDLRYQKKVSSQTDFGSKIGYNKSHVSELMNGKKPITNTLAATLQTKFGIRVQWLMEGEGEMLIGEPPEKPAKRIPVLSEAAGGQEMQMAYNDNNGEGEYIDVGDMLSDSEAAIPIYGNSMTPNYPSGCLVGLKRNYDDYIQPGEIYLIQTRSNRVLKRLYYNEDKSAFVCYSDNTMVYEVGPRKGKYYYEPFEIKIDDSIRLFDVVGVIKRTRNSQIIQRQK